MLAIRHRNRYNILIYHFTCYNDRRVLLHAHPPEKKRKKEEENLRNSLKAGDRITTIGGIVGKIVELKDENIVIETSADRVCMELARFSVMTNNTAKEAAQKARAEAQAAAKAKAEEKKKQKQQEKENKKKGL